MSKTYHIKTSKKELSAEVSAAPEKTVKVSIDLTAEELKQMRRYADLKLSSTPSEILKAFVKFGIKIPYRHNRKP